MFQMFKQALVRVGKQSVTLNRNFLNIGERTLVSVVSVAIVVFA